ncbi:MAG: conserved phage-associated protein, partial [Paenibacillus sp.]|nr:conserved phage-associated protein [Paenibacillus sp.]
MTITKNTDTKVVTGKCRLSYVHVFEPSAIDDSQEKKYSVALLIPKTDKETLRKIKAAVEAVKVSGAAKWGGKVPANLKTP